MKSPQERFKRAARRLERAPAWIHLFGTHAIPTGRVLALLERAFIAGWVARGRNFYSLADRPFKQKRLDRMDALTGGWAWRGK